MEEFSGKQPKRRMARKVGLEEAATSHHRSPPREEEEAPAKEEGALAPRERTSWSAALPSGSKSRAPPLPPSPNGRRAPAEASEMEGEAEKASVREYGEKEQEDAALILQRAFRCRRDLRQAAKRRKCHSSRINISAELLETEKNYVRQLKVLSSSYLHPLKSQTEVLGKELSLHLVSLLGTVEVIVAYHDDFLEQITERVEGHWDYSSKLGDVFMRMAAYLKSYTQYVAPYQTAVRLLALRKEDEELQLLLESLRTPECNGKGLKDLLIMPVQRIPRYNMILSDLKKNTWPEHRDYADLCEAAARVLDIANHVETMSAEGERLEKKLEIASVVKFPKGQEIILAAAHRRFHFDHRVEVRQTVNGVDKNRTLHLFAFSDLILFCTPSKSGKDYKAYTHLALAGCKYSMVPNPDDGDMCLLIHTSKGEMLIKDNANSVVTCLGKLISDNSSSLNHTKEAGDRTMVPVSPQKSLEAVRAESPSGPKGRLRRSLSFKSMRGVVQKNPSPSASSAGIPSIPSSPLGGGGGSGGNASSTSSASSSTSSNSSSSSSPGLSQKAKQASERKAQHEEPGVLLSSSPKFGKLRKRLRSQSMATGGSSPDMKTSLVAIASEQKKSTSPSSLKRSRGSPSASRRTPGSPSLGRRGTSGGSSASKVRKARSFQHKQPGRDEIVQTEELPLVILDREELEVEMITVMKKIAENEMALRSSGDAEKMDLLTSTAELKVQLGKLKTHLMSSCSSGDERPE